MIFTTSAEFLKFRKRVILEVDVEYRPIIRFDEIHLPNLLATLFVKKIKKNDLIKFVFWLFIQNFPSRFDQVLQNM